MGSYGDFWGFHEDLWHDLWVFHGFPKLEDPQVTIGFNTKSWSDDLEGTTQVVTSSSRRFL